MEIVLHLCTSCRDLQDSQGFSFSTETLWGQKTLWQSSPLDHSPNILCMLTMTLNLWKILNRMRVVTVNTHEAQRKVKAARRSDHGDLTELQSYFNNQYTLSQLLCTCMCMCIHVEDKRWRRVFFSTTCHLSFWDQVSHRTWSSLIWLTRLSSKLQGSPSPQLPQFLVYSYQTLHLAFGWV